MVFRPQLLKRAVGAGLLRQILKVFTENPKPLNFIICFEKMCRFRKFGLIINTLPLNRYWWCTIFMPTGETEIVTEIVRTVPGTGIETEIGTETGKGTQSCRQLPLTACRRCRAYFLSSRWPCTSRLTHSRTCRTRRASTRSWRRGYSSRCGSTKKTSTTSSHATRALSLLERRALEKQHRYVIYRVPT